MRVLAASDLHGTLPTIPECDLLLLAGDYSGVDSSRGWYENKFLPWMEALPCAVIATLGNHDGNCPRDRFLINAGVGKIWATPYTLRFGNWSYMTDESTLERMLEDVPHNLEYLISHGPPYGIGDETWGGEHVGSRSLLRCIEEKRPQFVICGHIHEAAGVYDIGNTKVINTACCITEVK